MNWIYICYLEESRLPLWSSGQSSWLQIQRSGFDFRRYQIFWEAVGLGRGSLSLESTTEELLERKSSSSALESREYGRRAPSHWPRDILYSQKLSLTSPKSGGLYSSLAGSGHLVYSLKQMHPVLLSLTPHFASRIYRLTSTHKFPLHMSLKYEKK
jgi:hypothetical protein